MAAGKNAPRPIRNMAGAFPMPKKTSDKGTHAVTGMLRRTWIVGSKTRSIARERPISRPTNIPSATPQPKPAKTRHVLAHARSSPSPDRTRPRAPPMAAERHYAARSRSRCRPATTGGSPREISRIAERWMRAAADTSGSRPGRVEPPQMSFAAPSPRGQFGGGQARCLRDKRHVDEALHRRAEILLDPAQLVQLFGHRLDVGDVRSEIVPQELTLLHDDDGVREPRIFPFELDLLVGMFHEHL